MVDASICWTLIDSLYEFSLPGEDNIDSETVVTDGFCRFDEVINQCLLDGPRSSVHSSRSTGS